MRYRNIAAVAVSAAVVASLAAACSSGGSSSSGGSGGGGGGGRGPITVVQGKDNSNTIPTLTQMWNSTHPNEKVTFKQQSDQADQQLQDLQQHFQAKDPNYDVVSVDVIWTAQFAAQGWIEPLKGQYALPNDLVSKLLPAPLKAATYAGSIFAAPYASDGGLLYYRKDLVSTPPKTWDELIADCPKAKAAGIDCYAGQFFNYEGLTCNATEAINTAGGQVVKEDGKTPNIDTPEAIKGLDFLVNGFKQGYIPKAATSYKETESLNSFTSGKLLFMRQWPYGVAIASTSASSKVKGKFDIAPLPGSGSGAHADQGTSTLGGHSFAMSVYGKHKATAIDFMKFMESDPTQKYLLLQASNAPVISALYTDPTLVAKAPYLPILLKSIQTAIPRPVSPFYPIVTKAIETNVYAALQGQKSSEQAVKDIQSAITSAASGGG